MKKYLVAIVLITLAVASPGAALAVDASKEPGGFRNIPWGQDFETIISNDLFVPVARDKGQIYYTKTGDDLTMGDAKLESLRYIFVGGLFIGARADALGADNADKLLRFLQNTYGAGDRLISGGGSYKWEFKNVQVFYNYDKTAGHTALSWITANAGDHAITP